MVLQSNLEGRREESKPKQNRWRENRCKKCDIVLLIRMERMGWDDDDARGRCMNRDIGRIVRSTGKNLSTVRHLFFIWILFDSQLFASSATISDSWKERREITHHRTFNANASALTFAQDFLMRYGYIPKENLQAGSLRSENYLRDSIREMQRFANLPETGQLDSRTLLKMKSRRCDVADFVGNDAVNRRVKRYTLHGSKWPKKDLTWSVKHWPNNVGANDLRSELALALKVWSDVSKLSFRETTRPDADIVISFVSGKHGDDYPFDGPGSILAHAFFPGEGIGGDAHFDGDERWMRRVSKSTNSLDSKDDGEGVSLFGVAAHEFGHSLGLSHSSVLGSLMSPYYQVTSNDDFTLPYDDTIGIQQLYGSKVDTKWAPLPTLPTTVRPPERRPVTKSPASDQPSRPTSRSKPYPSSPDIPDTCNTRFDAISSIRNEMFVFKGKYFWRLTENKKLERAYPVEINRFWYKLPQDLQKIDAVYERPHDKKIVFFTGQFYWVFNGNNPDRGFPRPLTDLGLARSVDKIDGVFVWGHNGKTYIFSGHSYWRFDEIEGKVELDYPRDMAIWKGVPYDIDTVFQWRKNGRTYFFKDKLFWEFDDRKMRVQPNSEDVATEFWFDCERSNSSHGRPVMGNQDPVVDSQNEADSIHQLNRCIIFSYLLTIVTFYCT